MRTRIGLSALFLLAACADGSATVTDSAPTTVGATTTPTTVGATTTTVDVAEQMFPDVIDATATSSGDTTWTISATVSSPYDSPERYADAWRVVGPDGAVYGERILGHDHADEQPFTRSQSGIEIPDGVAEVTIEARDRRFGYGGATFQLVLPVD